MILDEREPIISTTGSAPRAQHSVGAVLGNYWFRLHQHLCTFSILKQGLSPFTSVPQCVAQMLHFFTQETWIPDGSHVLCDSWGEDAREWSVIKLCWWNWGSLHRLLVFSLWRHSFPWDCPRTVQTSSVHSCKLGLMQCVCSHSRCPRPVPALATCWTLRQKEMAARLGLGSQRNTWARQWRRLSRRSSLSHGRCTCAGKEGVGVVTEEREMMSFERCLAH